MKCRIHDPLLSIIVPVYNKASYLCRCIDSILRNIVIESEVILVDDGSTDNSGDLCDEYAQRDTRIKVVHQPNEGLSEARNSGLYIARGEYIHFVDADDFVLDGIYEYFTTRC